MNTVQLALWAKGKIEGQEWGPADDGDENRQERTLFLGTVFALDPCGRYHHMLSPNGYTNKCGRYWESLERQLEKRGMWLTSGEGDPCDQFAGQSRDVDPDEVRERRIAGLREMTDDNATDAAMLRYLTGDGMAEAEAQALISYVVYAENTNSLEEGD